MAAEVLDRLGRDNVAFVLILMRDEADSGEYNSNAQQIFDELAGMHAKTVQCCMLQSEDFYTYESIFHKPLGQLVLAERGMQVMVFNPSQEVLVPWIT